MYYVNSNVYHLMLLNEDVNEKAMHIYATFNKALVNMLHITLNETWPKFLISFKIHNC
jgi:hypothetical protein